MLNVCKNIARDDSILFNSGKIKLLEKILLEAEQCFQNVFMSNHSNIENVQHCTHFDTTIYFNTFLKSWCK